MKASEFFTEDIGVIHSAYCLPRAAPVFFPGGGSRAEKEWLSRERGAVELLGEVFGIVRRGEMPEGAPLMPFWRSRCKVLTRGANYTLFVERRHSSGRWKLGGRWGGKGLVPGENFSTLGANKEATKLAVGVENDPVELFRGRGDGHRTRS
ncbi:unnamed protein product [Laminaria digitata]